MDTALFNGKLISAYDISLDYNIEKQVRLASNTEALTCPDPECKNRVLKYCHGEIKEAYFCHKTVDHCDYTDFDKDNSQTLRMIKWKLYQTLTDQGFSIKMDVKVFDHHYTHLLCTLASGDSIAVELCTQNTTARMTELWSKQYKEHSVNVCWLTVSEITLPKEEWETFFIKRLQLNESSHRWSINIDSKSYTVQQYIIDPNHYLFDGEEQVSVNYPKIYEEKDSINRLTIENGEITLPNFYNRYQEWLRKKKRQFNKRLVELEKLKEKTKEKERIAEEKRKEKERIAEETRKRFAISPSHVTSSLIGEKIKNTRPIRCKQCNREKPCSEFATYQGNIGTCSECNRNNERNKK